MYAAQPHIASFELRTYSYLKSLVEEYSIPCDWHSTSGVHAYYSESLFKLAQEIIKNLGEKYPDLAANVAVVTKGEEGAPSYLLEGERKELTLEGLRIPDAEGAVVQWNAASLWPYKLVTFVLERLLAAGGFNLQTNTPATGLQKVDPPSNLSTPHLGKKVIDHPTWIVHTARGHITTRAVLLATNAYTSHLIPQFSDLIVPTRGQVAALKPPQEPAPGEPPLDIGHTFYIIGESSSDDGHREDYLVQRPPPAAELVLGGGRQLAKDYAVGVWDDSTMDEPVKWWLRGELTKALDLSLRDAPQSPVKHDHPSSALRDGNQDLEPTHEWTGIMGYSRDAHPWVGPVPDSMGGGSGLWISAGYTGHGMPNAALCGKAAAELMTGAEEVDLPEEYELTEQRVDKARERLTVMEAEEKGGLLFDLGAVRV